MWMNEGVVDYVKYGENRWGEPAIIVAVRPTLRGWFGRNEDRTGGRIVFPDPDRITVVDVEPREENYARPM
jgi:hypothetical protein